MNGEHFACFRWVALNWPRLQQAGWTELMDSSELHALLIEDWRSGAR